MGKTFQKRGNPGDPHHILSSSNPGDTQQRLPPLPTKKFRVWEPGKARDMPMLVHSEPLTTGVPTQIKGGFPNKVNEGVPGLNKHWDIKLESRFGKSQLRSTCYPNIKVLPHETAPFSDQYK